MTEGTNHFAELISANHSLEYLYLKKNMIFSFDLEEFIHSLKLNTNLKVLDLSYNILNDETIEELYDVI
jgi:Leucine-rich repeat (LRR) protein